MMLLRDWKREGWFLTRDKTSLAALLVLLALSALSVAMGAHEASSQRSTIDAMIEADLADRRAVQAAQSTYGDAAYYSFYITYDPPSPLAFAALGQRDTAPFMKRIRLLAIEGQIYQGESPNPLLAQIGSLDVAFIAAYVLPLILIVLLYDLKAGERAAGRQTMLDAMPGSAARLWLPRIGWRMGLAFLSISLPFFVGALMEGAALPATLKALFGIAATCLFWTAIAVLLANTLWRGATVAACLMGTWLALNILVPLAAQLLFVSQVEGPAGSDVALLQREAVNDAWDKPKADIMTPFAQLYPQYRVEEALDPFDWRWYFAFQTMGDVAASDISRAYRDAIKKRDRVASLAAWVSPGLAMQRQLQRLARTDITAQLDYDAAIRRYHAQLRAFYFPRVFGKAPFQRSALAKSPDFKPS